MKETLQQSAAIKYRDRQKACMQILFSMRLRGDLLWMGNFIMQELQEWKSPRFITVCVRARLYTFHIVKRRKKGGWVIHSRKESRKPSLLNTKESISISSGAPTSFYK